MNMINFCGTMKMTKGMTCYNKNFNNNVVNELQNIGLDYSRGTTNKFDGTPVLNTDNIKAIDSMGIKYYLPDNEKTVYLRFNDMQLKQADFDSFLLAYNSVKDNDTHIDINV